MQVNWFKDRNVKRMAEVPIYTNASDNDTKTLKSSGFLCATARDYDSCITVLHTHDPEFKVTIDRMVTPGNYKFKDMIVKDGVVKILSVRDGELFLDSFKLDSVKPDSSKYASTESNLQAQNEESKNLIYYDAHFKTAEFQWPFYAYIYQSKEIVVATAHIPKVLFRFPISKTNGKTFLIESFNVI